MHINLILMDLLAQNLATQSSGTTSCGVVEPNGKELLPEY